jgi:hypothetical protein
VPSDNYDIRIEDQTGYDLLEGLGANRDTVKSEQVPILYASTSVHPSVSPHDTLFLVIDNHFQPSAQIGIDLYVANGY